MKLAILGATSQIAKDLIIYFSKQEAFDLVLYSRKPGAVLKWLDTLGIDRRYESFGYSDFNSGLFFDAIINFIGVGDPAQAAAMGASIFDLTMMYDNMVLDYLKYHSRCQYIFLSSGAVYGSSFDEPVDENTKAIIDINNIKSQDWYGVAKLYAESRHRAQSNLSIVDVRVFNYFSHTQDMSARFLMTDMVRAIRDNTILRTSSDNIVRDFIHPADFSGLIRVLLSNPLVNTAVDCYSKAPIDKFSILSAMRSDFGLNYEILDADFGVNATGNKSNYYSLSRKAEELGYKATLTSLDGLLCEVKKFLKPAKRV